MLSTPKRHASRASPAHSRSRSSSVPAGGSPGDSRDDSHDDLMFSSRVDPQVLQDVIDATFMVPGSDMLRAMRVAEFGRQRAIEECGGRPGSIDSTAGRMDQSRFPDLDLIRRRGFTEQSAVEAEDEQLDSLGDGCGDLAPDFAAFSDWSQLRAPWMDIFETVVQDPSLTHLKSAMATCLSERTGIRVDPEDPTGYLRAVNSASAGGASSTEMRAYATAYADCGAPYFERLGTLLSAERPAMVEHHREVLERYAAEIAEAGYAP